MERATMSFRGVITFLAFILLTVFPPYLASTCRSCGYQQAQCRTRTPLCQPVRVSLHLDRYRWRMYKSPLTD